MSASALYQAGKLQEAIAAQTEAVKADPVNAEKRLFLFELLAFAGDLDRAGRQLNAVQYEDVKVDAAVEKYRRLVDGERLRRRLFGESLQPQMFLPAPESMQWRLEAISRLREGREEEAAELLKKANEALPPLQGELNGKRFSVLRDLDDLLAGVLEVIVHGQYYWVPLEQVLAIGMVEPRAPRDLIYIPARLTLEDGKEGEVFLPALYPDSYLHDDPSVRLGRSTDWKTLPGEVVRGMGRRDFLVGEDVVSVLEWRQLVMGAEEDNG